MPRTVAIVGRPNVGKSRLFNRLTGKRISIVHDQPGITRDVIAAHVANGGFTLLDTGGLGLKGGETTAELITASERQVDFAIEAADLILFIIDGIEGLTAIDTKVAGLLRRSKKDVVLVVNKADFGDEKVDFAEIYRLGLGEPFQVSAEHGRGESYLREEIVRRLGPAPEDSDEDRGRRSAEDNALCVCFIGRPNVGKSSLSNRLLKSDRLIVSDVPGTTRDAVEVPFEYRGRNGKMYPFRLIDTAGIKAATKLASPVEYFARLRSLDSIQRADVVYLVLDALEGVTQQDKAIAGEAVKERKPIIIVVNKWDKVRETFARKETPDFPAVDGIGEYRSEREFRDKYEQALFSQLFFTPGSPVVFASAMTGYEVDRMLNAAVKLSRLLDIKIPTGKLNQTLIRLADQTPPPAIAGRRFRIYYATQTGNRPFRIRVFCNREEKLTEQYRRFLESGVVKEFGLDGCPVYFELVGKEKRAPGQEVRGRNRGQRAAAAAGDDASNETADDSSDDFSDYETLED